MSTVTVAPITTTIHGIATQVQVGVANGREQDRAVKCDQIVANPLQRLHGRCGWLLDAQKTRLHESIQAAFDLVRGTKAPVLYRPS